MTLKNRRDLRARFKKDLRPSQDDFRDLIGSTLNKRDDQFLGRWAKGTTYRTGDVVFHDRSIWELTDDGAGNSREICSQTPPGVGEREWQSLIVPFEDDDWYLVDLAPRDPDDPDGDEPPASMHASLRVVQVGVGTEEPQAMLDLLDRGRGRLLFNGLGHADTELCLLRLPAEADPTHVAMLLGDERASLLTDAPEGLVICHGEERDETGDPDASNRGPLLVAVKLDGRVGIGTEEPRARLEVTNDRSGTFLFNVDRKVNPALGIVNLRPGSRENYLAVGVDNDVAALVTDSEYGFLFRAGGISGENDHEVDINQGKQLVYILPDGNGKVGIGRQPEHYQLDVNGVARSYGFFTDVDESKIDNVMPLDSVLERIDDLRPVTFDWQPTAGVDGGGVQLGLVAHEVDDIFPEAVRTNGDRTKAVEYGSLVSVLVRAVQEQQEMITGLRDRVDDLAERVAELEA